MKTSELSRKSIPEGYFGIATEGAFWNVGLAAANKVVTLVGQVILAWLLTPADMGLAGMAIAMTGFTLFVSAGGISDVLIQRNRYEKEAGQGLWISVGLCLIMTVLTLLLVPIAWMLNRRDITNLLLILALSNLIWLPNPILEAKLKNYLNFKQLSIAYFLSGVSYTFFSIFFAWLGFGPFALICPRLIQNAVQIGYMFWKEGGIPIENPRWDLIKKLIKPTLMMSLTGFFAGLQTQAPVFCVGLLLSPTSTGYFSWGWAIASQAVFLLASNLRHVLLPVFSKLKGDQERQVSAVIKSITAMTAILVVVCGIQAILAQPVLDIFFPAKWQASGPVITWISLGLSMQGIWVAVTAWLNANGQYKALLWNNMVPTVLGAVFAFCGAYWGGVNAGAMGTGVGIALGSLFSLFSFPLSALKGSLRNFFIPLLISGILWFGGSFVTQGNLILRGLATVIFVSGSAIAWWYWDEGTLKKMVPRLFFAKYQKAGGEN